MAGRPWRRRPRRRRIAVRLLASLLFSQTLTALLFNVAPFDAPTLAAVSLLLLGWPRLPPGSPA